MATDPVTEMFCLPQDRVTRRRNPGPQVFRWDQFRDFVPVPNLVQLQLDSYEWFLTEGLRELFRSFSPVEDFTGKLSLEFLDSSLGEPKYPLQECREREVTFERPLRVRVMLVHKETTEIRESEVYLGELPMMSPRGTFIINGAERVVVSQLSRSPGVYFKDNIDNAGRTLYSAQVIPSEGAWIEFDVGNTNIISVKIGQTRKFPATTLLRAFHYFEEAEPMQRAAVTVERAKCGEYLGRTLAERVVDLTTGEILAERGRLIDEALAAELSGHRELTPLRVVEARLECASTRDLLRIFGNLVTLHQPLYLAAPVETPRGEPLEVEPGTPIDEGLMQKLNRWRQVHLLSPTRVQIKVQHGPGGEQGEMSLRDLQRQLEENPPLTRDNLVGKRLTGELRFAGEAAAVAQPFDRITEPLADLILEAGFSELTVLDVPEAVEKTIEEDAVPENHEESAEANERIVLESIYRTLRPGDSPSAESRRSLLRSMFFDPRRYDLARVGRYKMNRKLRTSDEVGVEVPLDVRWLTKHDLIAILKYLIGLRGGSDEYTVDDIDNLENKRVRAVGELLQNQLRLGFLRMERVARERMTSCDPETVTAQQIISIKPITAAIKSFFGSGALSQFMDQTNPLAELSHKRRVSSMGPGGLSRQSAKLEVRDVHRSHYGRLCPIMTPEGPNIGLISALAIFAKLNEFGFLCTPYRKVQAGRPTDELVYLTADQEVEVDRKTKRPPSIASASDWDEGAESWREDEVICRQRTSFPRMHPDMIDLIDVSPKQIFSAATSLIPFLENDDANRALMGSNMQRQAVPLVRTEAPWIGTGMEARVAVDSGAVVCSGRDGVVTEVDANHIVITGFDGSRETHEMRSFERTNHATFINQKPVVQLGQVVRGPRAADGAPIQVAPESILPDGATPGDPIADGSCTDYGRLALGKNVITAFMSWEGYNYEDAIIVSERLARDDVLTSVHIDKYEIQARETKLGPEEITADIPNISDELRNNLDERGIIRIGTVVRTEDILVGKVAPKGQSEMTAEEKLVIAIFGKKAEEMRDVSLRVPHGAKGKVIAVRVFSRFRHKCEQCRHVHEFSKSAELGSCEMCGSRDLRRLPPDDLPAGVNQLVRVYVAQRRKIMEGDKIAGRHGNKGVISKILPIEDMPFLADGSTVDVILNPLGVPSRMNIGQILETHLGWVSRHRGVSFETPVFASIPEDEIFSWLTQVYAEQRRDRLCDYLTGEVCLLADDEPPADDAEGVLATARERLLAQADEDQLELAERMGLDVDPLLEAPAAERVETLLETVAANAERRVGFSAQTGKMVLRDGRTGQFFDRDIMVGVMYIMKLSHLVDDKIHARSTGPYSLVTQQPLGGKAQFGGQRFGEMEVWALEAYGSAHSLQEVLTIKSDDVHGRVKAYESIVKGENIQEPGIPESFKILIKELQSLGLEVTVESKEGRAVDLSDHEE